MKIKRLNINSFRGIPNECELSFVDKQGEAISTIIYGTNGSGKSSIVDAIEFCLQGRIERSPELDNLFRPKTINLAKQELVNPNINITFDDNSTKSRQIIAEIDNNSKTIIYNYDDDFHPSFSNCPIALRRNDIISYNITPEERRQVLMLQFLYDVDIDKRLEQDPQIIKIQKDIKRKKNDRKKIINSIPKIINISEKTLCNPQNIPYIEDTIRRRFSPKGQKMAIRYTSEGKIVAKTHIDNSIFENAIKHAQASDKISAEIKKKSQQISNLKNIKKPEEFEKLKERFNKASAYLTTAFKEISNADYIKDIKLSIGDITITSLNIKITLTNDKEVLPNEIFSEANYDLMVLLLYLSLIRIGVDNGQEKVLILDDVLQSVDANIRANFIIYILKELKDWQLFITCHDRLWLNQLRYLFNNATHKYKEYQISNWSFSNGPVLKEGNMSSSDNTLMQAIKTDNIRIIASISGLFLEKICQELSCSINCSIERKPDDKYTIGDLWPSIKKSLKKTCIFPLIEKIDKLLCIRNLLGCHYNKWAESFSDEEVREFASNIQELYEKTFCPKCNTWIEKSRSKDIKYECKCRNIQY